MIGRQRSLISRSVLSHGLVVVVIVLGVSTTRTWRLNDVASPFAWFAPEIRITPNDLTQMNRREVVSRILPTEDHQLALFLASTIRVDAQTYLRSVRNSGTLQTSAKVPYVVRFSTPPRLDDLAHAELDPDDLEALRRCVPGDCDVKLSASEIARVRAAIQRMPDAWQDAVQHEFRKILLARAVSYEARGLHVDPYADKSRTVSPHDAFEDVLRTIPVIDRRSPRLAAYFREYPKSSLTKADSFLYWLKTSYTPKPTIQILHVVILTSSTRAAWPEVLVAWRQVYATHYLNAFLSVSALLQDPGEPQRRYLAHLNGSTLDGLHGWFGGLTRYFVERGAREGAEELFEAQRQRIEHRGSRQGLTPPGLALRGQCVRVSPTRARATESESLARLDRHAPHTLVTR